MMDANKKKILFVMQLPPPVHGVSVMNEIIRSSKIINEQIHCDYINLATTKDIKDLRKSALYKYFVTLKILFQVIFKLAGKRYDLVYITIFPFGFAFYKDAVMVMAAKLMRKKVLLHLHTYGFKKASEKSPFVKGIYRKVFKNTRVICLSDALVEDVEKIYEGEVDVLPNGIPQVNFENTYHVNKNVPSLLYLSNLIKGKGILLIIEAAAMLKSKGIAFKLRVAGAEGDVTYNMLQKLIDQYALQDFVTLLGAKYGEEKLAEFKQADVFLLPSDYDTFGLVLLEAMQFGVPCIATAIGAIPDVIGDGRGLLLNNLKPEELAEKMEILIQSPDMRLKISGLGFNYFKSNFTVQVFEQRCLNVLLGKAEKVNKRLVKNKV
ncbi:MAG: glycosyltransferase family 4 protein [Bacteroidota bacterium]